MEELAAKLLKDRDLKVTSQRLSILNILLEDASKAFSSSEIIRSLRSQMNRSTIYRSLDTLLEKEVVMKRIDGKGDHFYTLHLGHQCEHAHHPHMRCTECGKLECLPAFPRDYVQLLRRSGVDELNVVLDGVCGNCPK